MLISCEYVSRQVPAQPSAPTPSLDEYRTSLILADSLKRTHSVLPGCVPVVDKHKKRQRLIDKQVAALKWIELLISAEPVRDDWVAAWFDTTISNRLNLAGYQQ